MMETVRDVAIVGAGFAGLSTAKFLRELGYRITVFEKDKDVGGVWANSRRYPGLTTQNPRSTYGLSEFPMPRDYPEWPTGEQMQAYFNSYVGHFKLDSIIRLNTTVTAARENPDGSGWTISSVTAGEPSEVEEQFDFLIVCNGIFSIPAVPSFEGLESWRKAGGELLHTSEFNDLQIARDKNVLVIGYGKSSCDAAVAALGVSKSTTLIARHIIWKMPKMLGGVMNFKHLFLSRLGEAFFPYIELKGFEKFLHEGAGRPFLFFFLSRIQNVVEWQLKLREANLHPGTPMGTIARSTVSNVTDGFYEAVRAGTLQVKKDTQITRLEPGFAQLATGEKIPADLILAGTGWDQQVPFFDDALMSRIRKPDGDFRLYKSMIPPDVPRLAFNGYNSSFYSQLSCEVGAMWISEYLRGAISIPSLEEQDAWIERRLAWMRERTDGKHARGTNIIPFSIHQIDELLNEIDANLGWFTRFTQWFSSVDPSDYAPIYELLKRRAR